MRLATDELSSDPYGLRIVGSGAMNKADYITSRSGDELGHYAIVFLVGGGGIFESKSTGRVDLHAGLSAILIPGVAHRYGPDKGDEWEEYWMIFDGRLPDSYRRNGLIAPENAVIDCSANMDLLMGLWSELRSLGSPVAHDAGLRAAALGVSILSLTLASLRVPASGDARYQVVADIIDQMHDHLHEESFDLEAAVRDTPYSYTHFRRLFRQYTGKSPIQYYNVLKTGAAKRALMATDQSANAIGRSLGISDPSYFRRMFKRIEGMTPQGYRELMRDWLGQK